MNWTIFRPLWGLMILSSLLFLTATSAFSAPLYDQRDNTYQCMNTLELEAFVKKINGTAEFADQYTIWVFTEDRKTFFVWELTNLGKSFAWCIARKEQVFET